MSVRPTAEQVLRRLGVASPADIDLEAIAWSLGVVGVKERKLDGCEARIVGLGNRAIVSLDPRPMRRRRRFSLAHELGHWIHHRGRTTFCRPADIGEASKFADVEQTANAFASDPLLPEFLLRPIGCKADRLTLKLVGEVADQFDTTKSATLLGLLRLGEHPCLAIKYDLAGRRWFGRSPLVPSHWFPAGELDHETYAFDLLHRGSSEQASPRKTGADAFFDRLGADRFEVQEQSFRTGENEIMTIVTLFAAEMLAD